MACAHCGFSGHYKPTCGLFLYETMQLRANETGEAVAIEEQELAPAPASRNAWTSVAAGTHPWRAIMRNAVGAAQQRNNDNNRNNRNYRRNARMLETVQAYASSWELDP